MRNILVLAFLFAASQLGAQPFASFDKASTADLSNPMDLTIGPDGLLYVAENMGDQISVLDPVTLELKSTFGYGILFGAHDISFAPDGLAYVAASGNNTIVAFDLSGDKPEIVSVIPTRARVEGVLAHSNGRIYLMVGGMGELLVYEDGEPVAGIRGLFGAHDVTEALDGSIWVADNRRGQLAHFSADLEPLGVLSNAKFGFSGARYLAVDDFGRLVVADRDANRVLLIEPETETLLGVLGDGTFGNGANKFNRPDGAAVKGAVYYFADSDNDQVVRYVVLVN
jgi:DNA-binding beta-propeller fold protein YncE